MRLLLALIVLVIAVVAGLYAALPWLVASQLAPRLADAIGAEAVEIDMGHPGVDAVTMKVARLVRGGLEIVVADAELRYDLGSLQQYRLTDVELGSVTVHYATVAAEGEPTEAGEAGIGIGSIDEYVAIVPADRLRVKALELRLPDLQFLARGELTVDGGVVTGVLTGISPDYARDMDLTIDVDETGLVRLLLEDRDPDLPSTVRVEGRIEPDGVPLETELALQGSLLEMIQTLVGLPQGTGRLAGSMVTRLPTLSADVLGWREIDAAGTVELEWAQSEAGLEVRSATASFEAMQGMVDAQLSAKVALRRPPLAIDTKVREGRFRFDGSAWVSTAPASVVTFAREDVQGELELRSMAWRPEDMHFEFSSAVSTTLGSNSASGTLDGRIELGSPVAGALTFNGRAADYPVVLGIDYGYGDGVIAARTRLRSGPVLDVAGDVQHEIETGHGMLSIADEIDLRQGTLAATIPDWLEDYDLDGGRLGVEGAYRWGDALGGTFKLTPIDVRAHYEDYVATGAGGFLNVELEGSDWRLLPSALSVGEIDVGFALSRIALDLAGNADRLEIAGATARMLGGSATVGPFAYDLTTNQADLVVELHDLDLEALLALEGDDITGDGRLAGQLPIRIRDGVAVIAGGLVRATGPGSIRLAPSLAGAIKQPGLDIALRALGNFSYAVLESKVDYRDNGDLLLGLRLEGRNPEVEGGRPIHFNLNISENVPVLLRSLRMADAVGKKIEKQVVR